MRSVTIPEANYEHAKLHLQDQVSYDQEMQNNILSVIMVSRSLSPLFWIWAISCVNEHNNKISQPMECIRCPASAPQNCSVVDEQEIPAALPDQLGVMRDDKTGFTHFCQRPKHFRHFDHMMIVKSAGGLIKEKNMLMGGDGAADGHPLLLAAGQGHGMETPELRQVEAFQNLICCPSVRRLILTGQTEQDLLLYAFCEQLMVHILHDHIALLQSLLSAEGFFSYYEGSLCFFGKSAEAFGKG